MCCDHVPVSYNTFDRGRALISLKRHFGEAEVSFLSLMGKNGVLTPL